MYFFAGNGASLGVLFDRHRFAGQRRLAHVEVLGRQQPEIGAVAVVIGAADRAAVGACADCGRKRRAHPSQLLACNGGLTPHPGRP